MTTREKELRTKIGDECLYKGDGWNSDYNTSCEERYDFIRCPDDFECAKDYIEDFIAICDEFDDWSYEQCKCCWEIFLNGE